MIRKLFALASVTALGGLVAATGVAGCTASPKDDDVVEPKKGIDPTETVEGDGGQAPAPGAEGDAAAGGVECKAKISYAAEEIHPAAPPRQVCTADAVKALSDACAKDPNAQACTDARNGPGNQDCAACIFGTKDDAEWKVINLQPGASPGARYNQ